MSTVCPPYILITEPDDPLTEAIRISKERTNGYKIKVFGADILLYQIIWGVFFLLGLVQAAFYEETTHPTMPRAAAPVRGAFCPNCGTAYATEDAQFCTVCGKPRF